MNVLRAARPSRRSLLVGAAGLLAGACMSGRPERRLIRIGTGSTTAVYYSVGLAFKRVIERYLPNADAAVVATAASGENLRLVLARQVEVGFMQADILASRGEQLPPVAALARIYDDLMHLVARSDRAISRVQDLRGKKVSVGGHGSGTAVTARRVLTVANLADDGKVDQQRLTFEQSVEALADGRIDAFFFSGGLPVAGIKQLSETVPVRVIDLSSWATELRRVYSDVYEVRAIPSTMYDAPGVSTLAVPNLLTVSTSMPEDMAYDLTRLLVERRDDLARAHPAAEGLDIRSAVATLPVPLHPGASRYYRSIKP